MQQVLYGLIVVLGLVGYWWFTSGRHGQNATKVHLGLSPEEEVKFTYAGFFHVALGAKDVALALAGAERVGKGIMLTRTTSGVTVLKPQGDECLRFAPGDFRLHQIESTGEKLVGASGGMEPADVYEIDASSLTQPIQIRLARSSAVALNETSKSSAA
jgi:hypothetical protein